MTKVIKSAATVDNYGIIKELDESNSFGTDEELEDSSSGLEESKEGEIHETKEQQYQANQRS